MPKYAAVQIPNVVDRYRQARAERIQLGRIARQEQEEARTDQERQQQQQRAGQIAQVLQGMGEYSPEKFEALVPRIMGIDPFIGGEIIDRYRKAQKPREPSEPLMRNQAGVMVPQSQMVGQQPWQAPPSVGEEYFQAETTPQRREEILSLKGQEATATRAPFRPTPQQEYADPETSPARREELLADRRGWAAAGREPKDESTLKAATLSQKGAAARWKHDQYYGPGGLVEERARRQGGFDEFKTPTPGGRFDAKGTPVTPMSPQEYAGLEQKIQTTYREMIGAPEPSATVPLGQVGAAPSRPTLSPADRARRAEAYRQRALPPGRRQGAGATRPSQAPSGWRQPLRRGDSVVIGGQERIVKRVYPDGTFDLVP